MADSVEGEIRELRALFWSERDPEGRVFAPLADAYRRVGDLDQALEVLDDGLGRHAGFAPGHVVAGWVRRARGERGQAEQEFRTALDLDEENTEALRGLGEIAAERGDPRGAAECWRRLAELEPGDIEVRARLLDAEAVQSGEPAADPWAAEPDRVGSTDEVAHTAAELAVDPRELGIDVGEPVQDPVGPVTRTMAELYARQKLNHRALHLYRRLLEREPDDAGLAERVRALESLVATERAAALAPLETPPAPPAGSEGAPPAERARPRRTPDVDVEALARDWAQGPGHHGEIRTPFAWTPRRAQPPASPAGRPIAQYFQQLLSWQPGTPAVTEAEASPVDVEQVAPEPTVASVGDAAPAVIVPIESLAPHVVDIGSLAPATDGEDDFSSWLHRLG